MPLKGKERKAAYQAIYGKAHYQANKKKYADRRKVYCEKNKEKLAAYNKIYNKVNKEKRAAHSVIYRITNKEKIKAHYEANKKKISIYMKVYYQENKIKHTTRKKSYREANKEKRNAFERNKRKTNHKLRLSNLISGAILHSLKNGKGKNGYHWETLVPYNLKDLIKRLKKTLPVGYTWDNYTSGKTDLQIDHIIPISKHNFKSHTDTDFQRCWALKNLQLLSAFKNNSKGNRLKKPFQPSLLLCFKGLNCDH